ncbi:hypothetical protein ACIRSS_01280 [Amycolatopsis sp. NPDC101161]|uniref:hypothetical protein n=1 Tax=Amycolatopsis sp. NPDC101161 TaxID=3363940 RepID=UPI003819CA43
MSTLRRLAFAGAIAVPISLVIAGPSSATPLDGPYEPWSPWSHFETSGSYAGIGGAATTDTEGGSDWWGHHWSEEDTAYAGIGGAAVIHGEHSGADEEDCDDDGWTGHGNDWDDNDGDAVVVHHQHHHAVAHPDPVAPAEHVVHTRPVHHEDADDNDDASYVAHTHSADMNGATSAHIASHAGDHHASYEAGSLTAGPGGASSEGVHSLALPGYAGYHNWYAAAGADGAAVHSVSSVADAVDGYHHYSHDYDEG